MGFGSCWSHPKPTPAALAWDKAPNKTNDLAALQNGAKLFVNYCLNCHSAAFMRFNRLKDMGLTGSADQRQLAVHHRKSGRHHEGGH